VEDVAYDQILDGGLYRIATSSPLSRSAADGRSVGSTQLVTEIYKNRLGVYEALTVIHKLLTDVVQNAADLQTVANDLVNRAHSVSQDMSIDTMERAGQMGIFILASALLRNQSDLHVPSDDTVHRQPRIDELMRTKNMTRQQAHAFVIDAKLAEWSRDLEPYLKASK
jgi:type II secretory ATPase GspE/PulE/Tfp pilus assembly ATPase PilB-like protein